MMVAVRFFNGSALWKWSGRMVLNNNRMLYVVRRKIWDEYNEDDIPAPQEQYLAASENEAEAMTCARSLERGELLRHGVRENLFARGLDAVTSRTEAEFREWMLQGGMSPPTGNARDDWRKWWEMMVLFQSGCLTSTQLRHLLDGMDLLPLRHFEVVQAEQQAPAQKSGGIGYAVVHKHWLFDDSQFCGANDVLSVYCTREAAEAERQRRSRHDEYTIEQLKRNRQYFWRDGPDEYVIVEVLLDVS